MKITITLDEAIQIIKQHMVLPFPDYELVIGDIPQIPLEPAPATIEEKVDMVLVERERISRILSGAATLHREKYGSDTDRKIWVSGVDMKGELINSLIIGADTPEPYLMDFPLQLWKGTTYQEKYDEEKYQKEAAAKKAEEERLAKAKAKIEAEVEANNRKLWEIQRSERYAKLKAKYGERTDDYEQWKIWEEEEEAFEKLKANEAADIKFYADNNIPLPFTPKYQEANSIFRIDGMSHEEYAAKAEADRIAAEKEQEETLAILKANPDLAADMAGKPIESLTKQLEAARKAMNEPKPKTSSIFASVTPVKQEPVIEQEPAQEEDPVCIPTGKTSTPFATVAPITSREGQDSTLELSSTPETATEPEPVIELKDEVPVFIVDDRCPWDDQAPVLV